jgi:hypothetical protein
MVREKEVRISKDVLPDLPDNFEETNAGDLRGAKRQYRSGSSNLHAREYDSYFEIHVDRADPRRRPLLHLALDSPESVGAFVLAMRRQKKEAEASRGNALIFLFTFIFFNRFLGDLKRLFRSLLM